VSCPGGSISLGFLMAAYIVRGPARWVVLRLALSPRRPCPMRAPKRSCTDDRRSVRPLCRPPIGGVPPYRRSGMAADAGDRRGWAPRRLQGEVCRMAGRDRRGSVRALRLVVQAHRPAGRARALSFLNCPRCGLSVRPKARWLTIEYCPRWTAPPWIPVRLFSSALPTVEPLYGEGSTPHAEQRVVRTTITANSQ